MKAKLIALALGLAVMTSGGARIAPATITDTDNGKVTVTTTDGNTWELADRYDLKQGSKHVIVFDTHGTKAVTDDTIIRVL